MKILFLSENYFPNVSGVPVVVKYLAEGLLAKGYQVAIATRKFKDEPLVDNINGVDVYRFNIWKDVFHSYRGNKRDYLSFVKCYHADIIIIECSQCVTTDLVLPYLNQIGGKKIFHSHGFHGMELKPFTIKGDLFHTIGNFLLWLSSKWYYSHTLKRAMPYFDATMCLSEVDSSNEYLKKNCNNSIILDNAADNMFFNNSVDSNILNNYTSLQNKQYIMCCANYTFVKNQKGMILQYYKSETSKKTSLVCIGLLPTNYFEECKELVARLDKQYGHRDVHLLHGVNRSDIPSIMANAYIYLVSSRYEQYSISIIEAMSQGLPFISMNTGNARLLPGGITIDNIDEMHTKIDEIMSDSVMYGKYAKDGKSFAYKYCRIDAVVNKLDKLLSKLL